MVTLKLATSLDGRIAMPEVTANLAWGDEDLKTLYMTGSTSLYRIRIAVAGLPVGPSAKH